MTVQVEWVKIPEGPFTMGSNEYENKSDRERKVTVKAAYEIMKTPVTNGMYKKWLDSLPESDRAKHTPTADRLGVGGWKDGWYPKGKADHPVTNVSYDMAKAYAEGNGWSVPSSAKWEKAARGANDKRDYPWGTDIESSKANYGNPRGATSPVNEHTTSASPYGVLGMAGNVWEWTSTSYDANNSGRELVLAGGSYGSSAKEIRVHMRKSSARNTIAADFGFRCTKK